MPRTESLVKKISSRMSSKEKFYDMGTYSPKGKFLRGRDTIQTSRGACSECQEKARSGSSEKPPFHPNCRCGQV